MSSLPSASTLDVHSAIKAATKATRPNWFPRLLDQIGPFLSRIGPHRGAECDHILLLGLQLHNSLGKSCSWLKHQLYAGKADCPQRAASFLLPSSLHILATGGEVKVAGQTQGSLKGLATKPMRPRALTRFRTGCHQSAGHDNVRF